MRFSLLVSILSGILALVILIPGGIILSLANSASTLRGESDATSTANARQGATYTAAVATASANPYVPVGGALVFNESFKDGPAHYGWEHGIDATSACEWSGGMLIARSSEAQRFTYCAAANPSLGDFTYEVRMTFMSSDLGGCVFRWNSDSGIGYYFRLQSNGYYDLLLYGYGAPSTGKKLLSGHSPTSLVNLTTNVLAVVARGQTIDLYINHQKLNSLTDGSVASGQLGVVADNESGQPTDHSVAFTSARAWKL